MSFSCSFTVSSGKSAEAAFDYLADLRNLPEWDPETDTVDQTSNGNAAQTGATFKVRAGGRFKPVLDYELIEFDRPSRFVARGATRQLVGVDTFTIRPTADGGCEISYETAIDLKGIGKLNAPVARRTIERSGEKTRAGLQRALGST